MRASAITASPCSRAAASPTARPTCGGRSPRRCARRARSTSAIRSTRPTRSPGDGRRTASGCRPTTAAEVERVDRRPAAPHGLRGVRSATSIPHAPAKRHAASVLTFIDGVRAPASRGRAAVRPALGRRRSCSSWSTSCSNGWPRCRSSSSPPPAPTCSSGGGCRPAATTSSCSTSIRSIARRRRRRCSTRSSSDRPRRAARPSCSIAAAATRSSSRSSSRCWRRRRERGRRHRSGPATGPRELPHTLRGLVAARLDSLTVDERCTLEDAAVLGRRGAVIALADHGPQAPRHDDAAVDAASLGLEAKELLVIDDEPLVVPLRSRARGRVRDADQGRPGPTPLRRGEVDGEPHPSQAAGRRRPHRAPLRDAATLVDELGFVGRHARRDPGAGAHVARSGRAPGRSRASSTRSSSICARTGSSCSAAIPRAA